MKAAEEAREQYRLEHPDIGDEILEKAVPKDLIKKVLFCCFVLH
jgi:hypothetical protein